MPLFGFVRLNIILAVHDVTADLQVGWPSAFAPPILKCPGVDPPPTRKLKLIDVLGVHAVLSSWLNIERGENGSRGEGRRKVGER